MSTLMPHHHAPSRGELVEKHHVAVRRDRRRRRAVVGLGVAGAALFVAAFFLPWWNFALVAPQYPKGLDLQIWLTGVTGDLSEIDILNHYIGMKSLGDAAAFERSIAKYLIALVALAVPVALLIAGRKAGWAALIPAIGLPAGFLVDTFYHMWHFGHDLDPAAPLNFDVFTPTLFGQGMVGQFHTWAWPGSGYWLALGGLALVTAAVALRRRVCNDCALHDVCGATCPRGLLGQERA